MVRYLNNGNTEFEKELRKRVQDYFKNNHLSKKANPAMFFRVLFYFICYWGSWYFLVFYRHSPSVVFSLLFLLFMTVQGLAYNVVHDACHEAITGHKKIDGLIYWLSMGMLGADPFLWKVKHNINHHFTVNVPHHDSQIEGAEPFLRLSPHQKWHKHTKYQHLYFPLVYSIVVLHWFLIRDFQDLLKASFRKNRSTISIVFHLLRVLLQKSIIVLLFIILPWSILNYPLWGVIGTFILFNLAFSIAMNITFAISHINKEVKYIEANEDNQVKSSFIYHQLACSSDYSPNNPIINFFFGGMAAHVGHHLFPNISSIHLKKITPIIESTCREYKVQYNENSILKSLSSHYYQLKDLSIKPKA